MKKKLNKSFIYIILTIILISSFLIIKNFNSKKEEPIKEVVEEEIIKEPIIIKMDQEKKSLWDKNEAINTDFVANISFDNKLLDTLPIVQTYDGMFNKDGELYKFYSYNGNLISKSNYDTDGCDGRACNGNDVYLILDWKNMEYSRKGSVFMDYRNKLDDKNIILYGHHFSRAYYGYENAGSVQFTNLDKLLNKDNYEDNKYLELVFENEIRRYEIAIIFKLNVYDETDLLALNTDFDHDYLGNIVDNYFDIYYQNIKNKEYYDTGVSISADDNLLTLVTCLEDEPNIARELVICKEIERITY